MALPYRNLIYKFLGRPTDVSAKVITSDLSYLKDEDIQRLRQLGVVMQDLSEFMYKHTLINYERSHIYRDVERSMLHPIMASAMELYADSCSNYSKMHNKTVWITSENSEYRNQLDDLLEKVGLEERIFDWAWSVGQYGDLFIRIKARPGVGIISIDDDDHPINMSRVDVDGRLVGFFKTPLGELQGGASTEKILPPWEYCLHGDTKVRLLDGTVPTIYEMAEQPDKYIGKYVYSINPETKAIEPDKIVAVGMTRKDSELVRVHLDNEQYVDCTLDHKFMLRDGSYKDAQLLVAGDSLMPLYTKLSEKVLRGYELVYSPKDSKWHYTFRTVFSFMFGPQKRGEVIHHKDLNKANNDPLNLKKMRNDEHIALHGKCTVHNAVTCPCARCSVKRGVSLKPKSPWEVRTCACGCGETFEVKLTGCRKGRKYVRGHWAKVHNMPGVAIHNKDTCICTSCRAFRKEMQQRFGWKSVADRPCNSCGTLFKNISVSNFANHVQRCKHAVLVLNHKVVHVEYLNGRADVYCLGTERNHNFALSSGIFVKNCHFRLLGVKKKRTMYDDPMMSEYKTLSIVTPEVRQISSKYGTSLLLNALPAYKRLRMAEDALLMSRLSKSMLKYIYKVKVDGCLRGTTHIRLLDGTSPTIKEMSDNSEKYIGKGIWTVNSTTKKLEVGRVLGIPQTRKNAEMVRVHLDNDSYADVTPDHKFMLRDGTFCVAEDLQAGTSLMPHYEKKSEKVLKGYNMVYDPSDNKYHYEHRHVAKDIVGRVVERGLIVHHKDFHKEDNDPENLGLVTQSTHISLHHKGEKFGWGLLKGRPQSQERVARRMQAKAGYRHSDETRQKIAGAKLGKPTGRHVPMDDATRAKISTTVRAQYASGRLANKHNVGVHLVAREIRYCVCGCGYEQTVLATDPWRYKLGHRPKENMRKAAAEWHRTHPVWNKGIKNHKVVRVEPLNVREDVYDLQVDVNHNFPLGIGIFVHNSNLEAVGALLDEYKTVLKRARAMDLSKTSPYFADKMQDMVNSEDVILPVWGDVGNVSIEKLGGEADIHWITDIEELRNQLAIGLRCPLQLLGGYIDEVPGSLGKSSVENLDIRFARSARRLQRSTIEGIKRMCQIHLAYKGMSPDAHLFDVNMAEISTAEEQELKNALDTGVDVVDKLMELIQKYAGNNVDMMEILDYLNQRILKLNDINFNELKIKMQKKGVIDLKVEPGAPAEKEPEELPKERRHIRNGTTDLMADTVLNEAKWNMRWGGKKVTIKNEIPKET